MVKFQFVWGSLKYELNFFTGLFVTDTITQYYIIFLHSFILQIWIFSTELVASLSPDYKKKQGVPEVNCARTEILPSSPKHTVNRMTISQDSKQCWRSVQWIFLTFLWVRTTVCSRTLSRRNITPRMVWRRRLLQ